MIIEDARLFLTGAKGVTRSVVLIHLAEEVARGEYTNRVTGQKVKCWKAIQVRYKWPGALLKEGGSDGAGVGDDAECEGDPLISGKHNPTGPLHTGVHADNIPRTYPSITTEQRRYK